MSGKDKEVFSNTRKSTSVRQFMFGLLPIIIIEFVIVGVVIYLLVPKGWPLLLAFIILFCVYLYATSGLVKLFRSAHLLSADHLYLRLATWFKCRLPLSLIAAVEQYTPLSYPKPDMVGAMLVREGETLYCLSRKSDVCRIQLTEPVMVKAPAAEDQKNKSGLVLEMLINVDEPERFLESMNRVAPGVTRGLVLKQTEIADAEVETVKSIAGESKGVIYETTAGGAPSVEAVCAAEKDFPNEAVYSEVQTADSLPSLEFEKLTRYYGDFPAVQDLTLQTYPREIFGFLGANGAGKTTTIRMITGLLRPTSGKVMVGGEDLWQPGTEARRLIGFVPDTPLVYERLTAREHMMLAGRLYSLPRERIEERTEELLSILGLEKWGDQIISAYSMGMKRKISLALALLTDPELIIVDELTNAFDAPTLALIKDILIELRNRGKTVFMSTHVMDVAEKICDRVGIIHQGQLKALGTVDELCRTFAVEGGLEPLFLKIAAGKGAGE
ncbi:MAG: ABC transporter ATP-binding protein [Syntrophaceticus sp.]|nr:ABC transporter ATP-binding protein [Syntrophaceticus sp.]MDD3314490.1 ABC transporter ATP-binding protein [Syntrophaceticus sp.]MDD4359519.1 ABC transporter ATP-binding protein [Syntrophaceticus sp.]MDD4782602.1 ABC transporter ATP-binding protein [Syntrophaceticus sp.]